MGVVGENLFTPSARCSEKVRVKNHGEYSFVFLSDSASERREIAI